MKYPLLGLIRLYQILLSPIVNMRGPVCRFYPSCSHYGYEAIATHGAAAGGWLTVRRLVRCHPWNPGGYDPVPPKRHRDVIQQDAGTHQTIGTRASRPSDPGNTEVGPNTSALGA